VNDVLVIKSKKLLSQSQER